MSIPIRLTEENFRRFEPIIAQAVKSFPDPIVFKVEGLSIETVICRMRDAINAYLDPMNQWESEINRDELRIAWSGSVLTADPATGKCRFGSRSKKALSGSATEITTEHDTVDETEETIVECPSQETVNALVHLLSLEVVKGMFRLRFVTKADAEMCYTVTVRPPNVEAILDDTSIIIL